MLPTFHKSPVQTIVADSEKVAGSFNLLTRSDTNEDMTSSDTGDFLLGLCAINIQFVQRFLTSIIYLRSIV